jgi:hypothetical protein
MVALCEVEPPRASELCTRLLANLHDKESAHYDELCSALRRVGPAGLAQLAVALDRRGSVDRHIAVVELLLLLYEDRGGHGLTVGDPNLSSKAVGAVLERARGHADKKVRELAEHQVDWQPMGWPNGMPQEVF